MTNAALLGNAAGCANEQSHGSLAMRDSKPRTNMALKSPQPLTGHPWRGFGYLGTTRIGKCLYEPSRGTGERIGNFTWASDFLEGVRSNANRSGGATLIAAV